MGLVKAWQEEIWDIEATLGEGSPFTHTDIENMAQERLLWQQDKTQGLEKSPHLKKLNDYLATVSVIPE